QPRLAAYRILLRRHAPCHRPVEQDRGDQQGQVRGARQGIEDERGDEQESLRNSRSREAARAGVDQCHQRQEEKEAERAEGHQEAPPPVTGSSIPLMKSLSGESRNWIAPTTSAVVAMRPRGAAAALISLAMAGTSSRKRV